jgi:hypothetical protein
MNANELADELQKMFVGEEYDRLVHEIPDLLRKQADLIRNLQKSLGFKNSGYETINLTPPVAWMSNGKEFYVQKNYCPDFIPLYTHPAETITLAELRKTELYRTEQTRSLREFLEPKELTDEEIEEVFLLNCNLINETFAYRDFARAILRKAQEK